MQLRNALLIQVPTLRPRQPIVYTRKVPQLRARVVLINTATAILLQLVVAAFGFITPRLILGTYGSQVNGLVSSINQLLRYFNLLEAGLSGAAIFALFAPLSQRDFDHVNKILSYTRGYYRKIGVVFLLLLLVSAPVYAYFFVSSTLPRTSIVALFLALGSGGALEFLFIAKYRVLLVADEKGYVISVASILGTIVYQSLVISLILAKMPVVDVYVAIIPVSLLRAAALAIGVRIIYRGDVVLASQSATSIRRLPTQRFVFMHELALLVNQATPIIVIGKIYSLALASVFAIYSMPMVIISALLATFHQAFTPSLGHIVAAGDVRRTNAAFGGFAFWYLGISASLLTVTAYLLTPFVALYTRGVHDISYSAPGLALMLALLASANSFRVVLAVLVSSFGLYKETAWWALSTSVFGLLLTLILGRHDLNLVLLGPVIALTLNGLAQHFLLRRHVPGLESRSALSGYLLLLAFVTCGWLASAWRPLRLDAWPAFTLAGSLATLGATAGIGLGFAFWARLHLRSHLDLVLSSLHRKA